MKPRPARASSGAATRIAFIAFVAFVAFGIACLVACDRDDRNEGSAAVTRSVVQPITAPTGSGPACDETQMRCTYRFAYVDHGEKSAEVRGDFRAGGWTSGAAMTKRGNTWTADVDVPYGRDVQYKLFLDGNRWVLDPAGVAPAPGSDNSRLDAVTCNPHRCQAP